MEYRSGYKYQLHSDFYVDTGIIIPNTIEIDYITLAQAGTLYTRKGYAWDGPSGPTIDTKNFMRGSLVHDALYQLMRNEMLPLSRRGEADRLLQKMCKEDGMSSLRAWWVYQGVAKFGKKSAMAGNIKQVHIAP